MKSSVLALVTGVLIQSSLFAENRLVVNGHYQIPVQEVLALQDIKNQLVKQVDWKKEAMTIMAESVEIARIGTEIHRHQLSSQLSAVSSEKRVSAE